MRIAQIMLARRLGGGEQVFIDLCGAAASRGHEVLAIGAAESDAMDALDRRSDLQCARVRCHGTWDPLCRWAIGRLLRRFEPDVVQTHMGRASALGGKAARSAGYPTLAMLHTMIELKYYRTIDLFVPTTADQEAYLRKNGVPADRVERIPHFRSMEPVAIAKAPRQTDGVVKTLGRFVHKKGFDVLLHAAAHAAAQGATFRLEIGGDGPERSSLKALAARLGIGDRVTFCGWIDDVAAFLADADLFVLPSRIEPFGIVVWRRWPAVFPLSPRASAARWKLSMSTPLSWFRPTIRRHWRRL
ncbi:Lipopolysaccharide core biosynthesis glycosyltransferase LpsD [Geodia barretti]|uniref:Lipopolysaccharide core biosynthesis glycosyltransferase LpsD n=1 Tax=Geodia barretti TaxID=519541 RepID=A0AA35TSI0_GEOBA|nr:Lipopolysaccharide core biosynthesis glycosyltransferase LpsD [Geodia barretti]